MTTINDGCSICLLHSNRPGLLDWVTTTFPVELNASKYIPVKPRAQLALPPCVLHAREHDNDAFLVFSNPRTGTSKGSTYSTWQVLGQPNFGTRPKYRICMRRCSCNTTCGCFIVLRVRGFQRNIKGIQGQGSDSAFHPSPPSLPRKANALI